MVYDTKTPITIRCQTMRKYLKQSISDCDRVQGLYGASDRLVRFKKGLELVLECFDQLLPEGKDYDDAINAEIGTYHNLPH